jgi:hypothetical protein
MINDVAARVTAARGVLQAARDNLDEAVAGLPYGEAADNAMASPALLAMLFRVVEARRRLLGLELQLAKTGVA